MAAMAAMAATTTDYDSPMLKPFKQILVEKVEVAACSWDVVGEKM
jgi:hypothetical protein